MSSQNPPAELRATTAAKPVPEWLRQCTGAVVVGDDGSDDAAVAVRWGLADSQRRNAPLAILRGWSLTTAPRPEHVEPGYVPSEDEFAAAVKAEMAQDARRALDADVDAALSDGSMLLVPVHQPIDDVLTAASETAAVTVVGARGSGLAKLLGSVSASLVRRARGPVVVVRRSPKANEGGE